MTINQGLLMEALSYDPETGLFVWNYSRGRNAKCGRVAGTIRDNGYIDICLFGKKWRAHRLAWLYINGVMPSGDIDHINGRRDDNRISNLRQASRSQNLGNSRKRVDNTSGYKGVSFDKRDRKWTAYISVDGKKVSLGYHSSAEEAHAAYCTAAAQLHGEFARAK